MLQKRITFAFLMTYLWVMMILLGSIVLETFMIYPNIFHDVPRSLDTALAFMAVRAPNDFFPPLGLLSWISGLGAVILSWRVPAARLWVLASVLMITGEGLVSMAFFWPRNTIMFIEGSAVHSAAFLQQTAREFQMLHWSRLAFNALGSAFVFTGFLRAYRHQIAARLATEGSRAAS